MLIGLLKVCITSSLSLGSFKLLPGLLNVYMAAPFSLLSFLLAMLLCDLGIPLIWEAEEWARDVFWCREGKGSKPEAPEI